MIEIDVRIHDKFSIELKIGYNISAAEKPEDFAVNMWMFVPNSLDINAQTYTKGRFYRDVKSNIRLITPVFLMREILSGQGIPYKNIEASFHKLASEPSRTNLAEYEYEIKMFMAIFKSSLRDETFHIIRTPIDSEVEYMCEDLAVHVEQISQAYRRLRRIINVPTMPTAALDYYMFGDEFMSGTIEKQIFRLSKGLAERYGDGAAPIRKRLKELIRAEIAYRTPAGYPVVESDSPTRNREVVYRQGVLKKYIESDLFLNASKKRDGVAMEQVYLSIAAGVSMIFATAVAFSFQQKYGNFTMPLFVALVVSYMLKDRIKDLMRYWFAHRLKGKYFDNKITVGLKEDPIGWIKEGMDFITDDKVPAQVMDIRNRSRLLQAENRISDEKIILFRKMVRIDGQLLCDEERYTIAGINDIVRIYLDSFLQKADNPQVPLYTVDDDGNTQTIYADKVYYMNMVIQLQHAEQLEYRRYRLVFNRQGIIEIELMK